MDTTDPNAAYDANIRDATNWGRKRHKYRAKAVHLDGVRFASKAEANRWGVLKMREMAGEIRELERQPRFVLHAPVKGRTNVHEPVGVLVADFKYREGPNGLLVVEDVKGMRTLPLAKWKQRHLLIEYGIQVREVRKGTRR